MEVNSVKKLGDLIKASRKKQGLTQTDLASVCDVGVRFIVDLEKGKETCQIGKAIKVIKMLGINLYTNEIEDLEAK